MLYTSEKESTMLNEIESLKAQLKSKVSCVTSDSVKPKVLAPGMYAIDVKPIPHPLKNNRSAHLNYISHLKESVETVREIVEEARVVKPLDNALNYACQYTKLSQELVEYVIGTCPKEFTERDNKAAAFIPLTRKKQVTFTDTCSTSTNNTQKHGVHQKAQQSNVQVIPSTGVSSSTRASGSKPRSNTKHNRIARKSVNNKKVEDHPRTNKSVWTKVNRVDSSISSKRVVLYRLSFGIGSGLFKTYDGNRSKLMNLWKSSTGQSDSGNDHLGAIMGYGRLWPICDSDLEVASERHTCFVRDIHGASKSKSWLWHRRLNHLNFGTINDLARKDLVRGLPRLKFEKDHLCSACQLGKSKKFSHKPKSGKLNMEVLLTFMWISVVGLNKTVRFIRTDNGTEFVNQVMSEYYEGVGIFHQKSVPRTPQQNGIVERRNRTTCGSSRTMMIFQKALCF
ncbi:retrovirus-related pol polyprotein from transposon TNT 1-94 [Tanacetum coccineum]|uniref:Retrovirus-related pol polyprotein from transposon TNT 1-94 n=1 Tax=Tanacetum coccineum TaxID=301880 RepID=A0ABQ5AF14_9ASTR